MLSPEWSTVDRRQEHTENNNKLLLGIHDHVGLNDRWAGSISCDNSLPKPRKNQTLHTGNTVRTVTYDHTKLMKAIDKRNERAHWVNITFEKGHGILRFFRVIDLVLKIPKPVNAARWYISAASFRQGRLQSQVIWTRSTKQVNLF